MINFQAHEARKEFEEVFLKQISTLTARQIWWFVKFAKHVRGRCRNNAAFNNYARSLFAPAKFVEVEKTMPAKGPYLERKYMGLEIRIPARSSGLETIPEEIIGEEPGLEGE